MDSQRRRSSLAARSALAGVPPIVVAHPGLDVEPLEVDVTAGHPSRSLAILEPLPRGGAAAAADDAGFPDTRRR